MRQFAAIGEAMIEMRHQQDRTLVMGFAGDSLNAATYLARVIPRAQVQINYVTALGIDPYSEMMLADWQQENIHTDLVIRIPNKLPGLYLIRTDAKGERTFYFYRSQSAARELFKTLQTDDLCKALEKMDYLYLSSITLAILDDPSRERLLAVLKAAKARGAKIIFDTNYRPSLWPDVATTQAVTQKIAPYLDIILPTFIDEQKVFNDVSPEACAKRWHDWGVPEVVIKCDANPCLVSDVSGQHWVPAEQVTQVIDTTSAGDAFNAGYLAARLQEIAPTAAAQYGHRLASVVIAHPGAIIPKQAMPDLFTEKNPC